MQPYQPIVVFGELKIIFDVHFWEDVYLFSRVETTSGLCICKTPHRLF